LKSNFGQRFGLALKIRPIKTAIVHRRMGRGGTGRAKSNAKFGQNLKISVKFWYVRKKILVTSPSPRSPTILGENINV
jgi:hypothetical protein